MRKQKRTTLLLFLGKTNAIDTIELHETNKIKYVFEFQEFFKSFVKSSNEQRMRYSGENHES